MEKDCGSDKIYNPKTKRCVDKTKKTASDLYKNHMEGTIELRPANVLKMQNSLKKHKKNVNIDNKTSHIDETITNKNILDILNNNNVPSYQLDIKPDTWRTPNKSRFTRWVDTTFKYTDFDKSNSGVKLTCNMDLSHINIFPHQKFIKDYMSFASPYRGILLYHELGSGKTFSSIAAAEILMNHMDVIVLLPASLTPNFVNEIKTYGRKQYIKINHWKFVPISTINNHIDQIIKLLPIDRKTIEDNSGLWIAHNTGNNQPNLVHLDSKIQMEINKQLDNIINHRYKFISYNGLTNESLNKLVGLPDKPVNIFDNKCLIVDEVHNLISRMVNGRNIGKRLKDMIYNAKNCKIIFLSGTPIINYPHEIAYLSNLLTGPRKIHNIKVEKLDTNALNIGKILDKNVYVDTYRLDISQKLISIELLPIGFVYKDKEKQRVVRQKQFISSNDIIKNIKKSLKQFWGVTLLTPLYNHTLPENDKDFNRFFINTTNNSVINKNLFMKRILGLVSYYSTYPKELFPIFDIVDVILEMSDYQFGLYEMSRNMERDKESKKARFKHNDGENIGQLYRFYSRAICNFAFPNDIKRPMPPKDAGRAELDDDIFGNSSDETEKVKSDEKKDKYKRKIAYALNKLENKKYLDKDNLPIYSPKFAKIIQNIESIKANILVYSQFKKVEGHAIFSLALNIAGYCEFKLKKLSDKNWDIDIHPDDYNKPKYVVLNPKDETSKVYIQIFNNNMDELPDNLKNKLKTVLGGDNLRGGIIKIAMVTQSGAEGISLKNVRQVHIVEPYWNKIRIKQVMGRAIRTCSHTDLPPLEQNVKVYVYSMIFTPDQIEKSVNIRFADKGLTTDNYIYNIAKRKSEIIDSLQELMQKASVDCVINALAHNKDRKSRNPEANNIKCFQFPVNMEGIDKFDVFESDINREYRDSQLEKAVKSGQFNGTLLTTKKGTFLVNDETHEVYDWDAYNQSGRLSKLGMLKTSDSGNKKIVKNT
jgi:hypothetical protein